MKKEISTLLTHWSRHAMRSGAASAVIVLAALAPTYPWDGPHPRTWDGSSGKQPGPQSALIPPGPAPPADTGKLTRLTSPWQLVGPVQSLTFDELLPWWCVNEAYSGVGIRFHRGDGLCIPVFSWSELNRITTSPPNVMGTVCGGCWTTFLEVEFLVDGIHSFGAFLGNDQEPGMRWALLAYDAESRLLGEVEFVSNGNTHVDEFIGISTPESIRVISIVQLSSPWYAVVLDNVMFSTAQVVRAPSD